MFNHSVRENGSRIGRPTAALVVVLLVYAFSQLRAQTAAISALAGYQFGGKANGANIVDDWNYSFAVNFPVKKLIGGEVIRAVFFYIRQSSEIEYEATSTNAGQRVDISIEYLHMGVTFDKPYGMIVPDATLSLGLTNFNQRGTGAGDELCLSAAIGGGVNFFLHKNTAFRIQARMLVPLGFQNEINITIPDDPNSGQTLATDTQFLQGDVSAGLVFQF
jgi:hypothetical protein